MLDNEKFTEIELNSIMLSCYPRGATPSSADESAEDIPSQLPRESAVPKTSKLQQKLLEKYMMYAGILPEKRPRIPRMKGSKIMLKKVQEVNEIIQQNLPTIAKIEEVVDLVYAGAITVCVELGIKITDSVKPMRKETPPPWKKRLEEKIKNIRKNIGILHTYLNTETPSSRVGKRTRQIASEFKIKSHDHHFRQRVIEICDRLKQKIKALGSRIQRYNERVKRYKNNQLYYKNKQKFFRQLEHETSDQDNSPAEEVMYAFWKNIWGEEKVHDDEAHWIREVEADSARYHMNEVEITEDDIKLALKKTNNWSAPGVDGIQNYWWKHFTTTHGLLAVFFQAALRDPSMLPDVFTLGVSYMLPKENNTVDPKKYRPITCLPTIYKILTGVLTRHIWKHVNKNNILAQEQSGCRGDARGCKELLITDYIITKQVKKKQRNISMAWVDYQKAFDSVPHSWLIKTLRMYGITEPIISLLEHLMKTWRTQLITGG